MRDNHLISDSSNHIPTASIVLKGSLEPQLRVLHNNYLVENKALLIVYGIEAIIQNCLGTEAFANCIRRKTEHVHFHVSRYSLIR